MRDKYKGKGKKKKKGEFEKFDGGDYDKVISKYREYSRKKARGEIDEIPDPKNPVGYDTINTYRSVVYNVWRKQVQKKSNNLAWDLIFTENSQQLLKYVNERVPRLKRRDYHEKLDGEFTPFQSMSQVSWLIVMFLLFLLLIFMSLG